MKVTLPLIATLALLFLPRHSFAQAPPPPPPSEAMPNSAPPPPPPPAEALPNSAPAAPKKAAPTHKQAEKPAGKPPAKTAPVAKPASTSSAETAPPPPPAEAQTTAPPITAAPVPAPAGPHPQVARPHLHVAAPKPATAAPAPGTFSTEDEAEPAPSVWPSLGSVFGAPFMRWALLAGLLVAGVCAYVGIYVVLKRIVFVGVALAEVSSAGVALALLMGFNPFLGAVVLMFAGIGLFSVRWAPRKVSQESFIGIGWAVASAFGVLLIAKSAQGEAHMHDLLFGNILTVDPMAVIHTAIGLLVVLIAHALFAKEFLFVSFDADTAAAMGYRARLWDLLLYATIGLAIAFSIHTVGVLLAFAALGLPPVTALLLTHRMKPAFAVSVLLGLLPVPIGLYLSFARDLPSSASIVAVMFGLLVLGGLAGRARRTA